MHTYSSIMQQGFCVFWESCNTLMSPLHSLIKLKPFIENAIFAKTIVTNKLGLHSLIIKSNLK